ncbi:MAG: glucosamine-6-phosphate deaminase [Niabella sp.]
MKLLTVELKIFNSYKNQSEAAAALMVNVVLNKPDALCCLATGDTPKLAYRLFVERIKTEKIDVSNCAFVGLDEWLGVPPKNSGSCSYYLYEHVFNPLQLPFNQIFLFDALTENEASSCAKMDMFINLRGGIDVMITGIGMNGHIGFNEPGTDEYSHAHVMALHNTTKTIGQKYFATKTAIHKGITQGLATVMESKKLLMLANGKAKAQIVQKTLEEPVSVSLPSTFIKKHPGSYLFIDKEAAQNLL